MHVSLTPRLEELVKSKVQSGMYNNASEVVREALRIMDKQERVMSRETLMQEVRMAVQEGLESGEPMPFDAAAIKAKGREKLERLKAGKHV